MRLIRRKWWSRWRQAQQNLWSLASDRRKRVSPNESECDQAPDSIRMHLKFRRWSQSNCIECLGIITCRFADLNGGENKCIVSAELLIFRFEQNQIRTWHVKLNVHIRRLQCIIISVPAALCPLDQCLRIIRLEYHCAPGSATLHFVVCIFVRIKQFLQMCQNFQLLVERFFFRNSPHSPQRHFSSFAICSSTGNSSAYNCSLQFLDTNQNRTRRAHDLKQPLWDRLDHGRSPNRIKWFANTVAQWWMPWRQRCATSTGNSSRSMLSCDADAKFSRSQSMFLDFLPAGATVALKCPSWPSAATAPPTSSDHQIRQISRCDLRRTCLALDSDKNEMRCEKRVWDIKCDCFYVLRSLARLKLVRQSPGRSTIDGVFPYFVEPIVSRKHPPVNRIDTWWANSPETPLPEIFHLSSGQSAMKMTIMNAIE